MIEHVPNQDDDLKLLRIFRKVVDANIGRKIEGDGRLVRGEGLATKFFDHVTAIVLLFRGTRIVEAEIELVDAATINIAARAAFESLLAFSYILVLPVDNDESDLRYYLWMLADLNNRQSYPFSSDESKKVLSEEKNEIDLLMEKLLNNPRFTSIPDKTKKYFLKKQHWRIKQAADGNWSVMGWVDIAIESELSNLFIRPLYNYLSSYAHTGFLSVMQLQTAVIERRQSPPLDGILELVRILIANMIDLYCQASSHCRSVLYQDSEDVAFVRVYLEKGNG